MVNEHKVLVFKAKLWGLQAKPPATEGNNGSGGEAPRFWQFFVIF